MQPNELIYSLAFAASVPLVLWVSKKIRAHKAHPPILAAECALDQLRKYQAVVFDLDGVVWAGDHAIPGAAAAIAKLQLAASQIIYLCSHCWWLCSRCIIHTDRQGKAYSSSQTTVDFPVKTIALR
jgi:hypothetical protein